MASGSIGLGEAVNSCHNRLIRRAPNVNRRAHPAYGADATADVLTREGAGAAHVHLACQREFEVADPLTSDVDVADRRLSVRKILATRPFASVRSSSRRCASPSRSTSPSFPTRSWICQRAFSAGYPGRSRHAVVGERPVHCAPDEPVLRPPPDERPGDGRAANAAAPRPEQGATVFGDRDRRGPVSRPPHAQSTVQDPSPNRTKDAQLRGWPILPLLQPRIGAAARAGPRCRPPVERRGSFQAGKGLAGLDGQGRQGGTGHSLVGRSPQESPTPSPPARLSGANCPVARPHALRRAFSSTCPRCIPICRHRSCVRAASDGRQKTASGMERCTGPSISAGRSPRPAVAASPRASGSTDGARDPASIVITAPAISWSS